MRPEVLTHPYAERAPLHSLERQSVTKTRTRLRGRSIPGPGAFQPVRSAGRGIRFRSVRKRSRAVIFGAHVAAAARYCGAVSSPDFGRRDESDRSIVIPRSAGQRHFASIVIPVSLVELVLRDIAGNRLNRKSGKLRDASVGYVGLVTGAYLAETSSTVVCMD